MLANRKQIKIINLGDVVTPDFSLMIIEFTRVITAKKPDAVIKEVNAAILGVIKQTTETVTKFKTGDLNEDEFNTVMIDALEKATGVRLTTNEFDNAWFAMNPAYAQFEKTLSALVQYHQQPDHQVIFVSFTNPKDMRYLAQQLKQSGLPFTLENGELASINGIKLFSTYTHKKSKAALIEEIIKCVNRKSQTNSALANSISNVFSSEQETATAVFYIRGVNNVNDPILKLELDKTNAEVEKQAQVFMVDTIIWRKDKQTLVEALAETEKTAIKVAAVKL